MTTCFDLKRILRTDLGVIQRVVACRTADRRGLLSNASLTLAMFSGVRTLFWLPPLFLDVDPLTSKLATHVSVVCFDGTGRLRGTWKWVRNARRARTELSILIISRNGESTLLTCQLLHCYKMVGATEGERLVPHLPTPLQWAQPPLTFFPFHCPNLYILNVRGLRKLVNRVSIIWFLDYTKILYKLILRFLMFVSHVTIIVQSIKWYNHWHLIYNIYWKLLSFFFCDFVFFQFVFVIHSHFLLVSKSNERKNFFCIFYCLKSYRFLIMYHLPHPWPFHPFCQKGLNYL